MTREIDDVGDQSLSYAEVKALATGNPHIVEKAGVDAEIAKLTRLRAAHQRDQAALARTHASATARAERLERDAAAYRVALDRRTDTRGDRFEATIGGVHHTERADTGAHLRRLLADAGSRSVAGRFAGFDLEASADPRTGTAVIELAPSPVRVEIDIAELAGLDPSRLIQRVEHRLARLERDLDDATAGSAAARTEADRAAGRLDQPFEHADRLQKLLARQTELERLLAPEPPEPPTVADRLAAVRCDPPVRTR